MKKTFLFFASLILFCCSNNEEENNTPNASIPEVTTEGMSYITYTTAETGGYIFSDAGFQITSRGVVWSTSQNPTISLTTKTINGVGVGGFNSSISGLSPNTTYYVRAYATNSEGTGYGNQVTFTTLANQIPTVATYQISNITLTTALSGVVINGNGGSTITTYGLVWSNTQNPTISLPTKTVVSPGMGGNEGNITGLVANTTYYVRAYATNSVGTGYGNEIIFTTRNIYWSMYPTGTVFCNNIVTDVVDVTNPITGKTWMDRNLGASQVATSSTDALAYGDLYQWGRAADGHQCRNSLTTTTLSGHDQPAIFGQTRFIIVPMYAPFDWRSPQNDNLWQGVNGINNPCPSGYRIPTTAELIQEGQTWTTGAGYFNSPLKLPLAGSRHASTGQIENINPGGYNAGCYWSSQYQQFAFDNYTTGPGGVNSPGRATGLSVRCIKN